MVIENGSPSKEVINAEAVGPVDIPAQMPEKIFSPWYVIEFTNYLSPFVNLLSTVVNVSTLVYKTIVAIEEFTSIWISAGLVVFDRLIFSPAFDPATTSFSNKIDYLEERLSKLEAQFLKITTTRFCSDYMILHDLEALEEISNEIKQISKLLSLYVQATGKPMPPYLIHARVFELNAKYKKLEQKCAAFIGEKQEPLLKNFQDMADMFIKGGVNLPFAIHRDLSKILEKINSVLFDSLPPNESYKEKIKQARKKLSDVYRLTLPKDLKVEKSQGMMPLALNNIGNSCYISSIFQALTCVDQVCEMLRQPIDPKGRTPEEMKPIQLIQEELLKFIESKEIDHFNGKLTLTEFILLISRGRSGPSVESLRKAIFESGLEVDLSLDQLKAQQDVGAFVDLLIRNMLVTYRFKLQEHRTTKEFPGMVWKAPEDINNVLKIAFAKDSKNKTYNRLWNLIYMGFVKNLEKTDYIFNPMEAVVVDKDEAAPFLENKPIAPGEYYNQRRLLDLPPVMVLQIIRYDNNSKKITEEVVLPENGIIDFTSFYDAPSNEPKKQGMYKVKSYVVHNGGYGGGHYVAYVEKNGKYFYCNDLPIEIKEISREEFLKNRDAYLIVFERLTPEEALKAKAKIEKKKAKETKNNKTPEKAGAGG